MDNFLQTQKLPHSHYLIFPLAFLLYLPGVSGPFLYDDFSNLATFNSDYLTNIRNFWYILTSGISSELGRPVSLITFLLQPQSFPASAFVYKLINILIHLGNGYLLYILSREVYLRLSKEPQSQNAHLFALLTASLWLCHPLFVSTTLYVIQRMTQLSFMFSLLTLIYFIRLPLSEYKTFSALVKPGVILSALILLSVLSKENGVMIFPILLILGIMLTTRDNKMVRQALALFCLTAIILLIWKLIPHAELIRHQGAGYDYGALERLLTQTAVVWHYLQQLIIPDINQMTLHHDDFTVIRETTDNSFILALLVHSVFITLMMLSKNNLLRFACLWFYLWHLLESSFLPLILYFEHRNYLPGVGIIWIISWGLLVVYERLQFNSAIKKAVIFLPLFYFAIQTLFLSFTWSDKSLLLAHWQKNNPDSERIAMAVFNHHVESNQLLEAAASLDAVSPDLQSKSLTINLAKIGIGCALEQPHEVAIERAQSLSSSSRNIGRLTPDVNTSVISTVIGNKQYCPETLMVMSDITDNILRNSPQKNRKSVIANLYSSKAFISLHLEKIDEALIYFEKAYELGRDELVIPLIDLNIKQQNYTSARVWLFKAIDYEQNRKPIQPSFSAALDVLIQRYSSQLGINQG